MPALRRDRQVAATLIGALILVIGAVWFSAWNSTRSQQAASDPLSSVTAEPTNQATGSPSTSATPKPTATPIVLPGCTAAPKAPGKGLTLTQQPDLAGTTGKQFLATMTTNCGALTIQLYGDKAPKTVSSFRLLAEKNYWKNTPCHRLVTSGIFVLQCGDPTGTGSGPGPGTAMASRTPPRMAKTRAGPSPWRGPRTRTAMATSSSSSTRTPPCRPMVAGTRSSGRWCPDSTSSTRWPLPGSTRPTRPRRWRRCPSCPSASRRRG